MCDLPKLSLKQQNYVDARARGLDLISAYRNAYNTSASDKVCRNEAYKLEKHPKIKQWLDFVLQNKKEVFAENFKNSNYLADFLDAENISQSEYENLSDEEKRDFALTKAMEIYDAEHQSLANERLPQDSEPTVLTGRVEYNEEEEDLTEDEDLAMKMNSVINQIQNELCRFKKIPGGLTTKYNTILNDVPALSKQTKIPEDEIVKAIKREADRAYKEPKLSELNFRDNQFADMRDNPDLYKGLTDEETDILFKNRKDKYLDIEKSTAYFNTGLDNVVYATGDELVPDIIKKAPKFFRKAGAAEFNLHAPRLADLVHDKVFYQKPVEKEFKKYTFDKQPDTHPVLDLIGDIIGVDYYNPNRWNKEDVEWFLNKAYEKGLFSNKDWTRWTPRQKVLKMKEIVQSPMAANFMKELRGTE